MNIQLSQSIRTPTLEERFLDAAYLPSQAEVRECIRLKSAEIRGFRTLCEAAPHCLYEIFTREFVSGLATHLIDRALERGHTWNKPLNILEVAAGNGRLTHFLKKEFAEAGTRNISITASDSFDWEIQPVFPVVKLPIEKALSRYQPQIVICCWMPLAVDFTPIFRSCLSVKEYFLIGEHGGNCCGTEESWHGPWNKNYQHELSQMQHCRTDGDGGQYSCTCSFLRT